MQSAFLTLFFLCLKCCPRLLVHDDLHHLPQGALAGRPVPWMRVVSAGTFLFLLQEMLGRAYSTSSSCALLALLPCSDLQSRAARPFFRHSADFNIPRTSSGARISFGALLPNFLHSVHPPWLSRPCLVSPLAVRSCAGRRDHWRSSLLVTCVPP